MNRIKYLCLFLCPFFNVFAAINVIYLTPGEEDIHPLDNNKYNVVYIVDETFGFSDGLKTIRKDQVCRIKGEADIKSMISCMEKFTEKFSDNETIDYLIDNGTELGVDMASQLRSKFGVKFGLTAEKAKFFLDKRDMKQRLIEKYPSCLTAPFVTFPAKTSLKEFKNTILAKLQFPIMIKQLDGHASIGVYHVLDKDALEQIADKLLYLPEAYIAEEFIPGRVLRIDGHGIKGKIEALYYSYYEPSCYDFYNYGQPQITYSDKTKDINQIKEFTAKILDAFEYAHGMFHLEAIEHEKTKDLYFLEIAARPGADSQFLLKLFNYDYPYLYWQLQLGFSDTTSQFKTMQEGDEYAVVDCPTLPYNDGEWALQRLAEVPSYTMPKECKIFMMNTPTVGQKFKLEPAPLTFMYAGFRGDNAYNHAKTFKESITTSFFVADQKNSNGKLIKWPIAPAKNIVKELQQSRKRKRESCTVAQPIHMPNDQKQLQQIKQEPSDSQYGHNFSDNDSEENSDSSDNDISEDSFDFKPSKKRKTNGDVENRKIKERKKCPHPGCENHYRYRRGLLRHIADAHRDKLEIYKKMNFAMPPQADMPDWKKHLMGMLIAQPHIKQEQQCLKESGIANKSEERKECKNLSLRVRLEDRPPDIKMKEDPDTLDNQIMNNRFRCPGCELDYSNRKGVIRHVKKAHPDKLEEYKTIKFKAAASLPKKKAGPGPNLMKIRAN
jgi:uncharacterized C2H2 Zn-finger protein